MFHLSARRFFNSVLQFTTCVVLAFSGMSLAADAFDPVGGSHIAVWRPSNGMWYVYNRTTGAVKSQQWGQAGDIPVPADYDGDGTTDFAIWRPSTGTWWVLESKTGAGWWWQWGQKGDIPVPGRYFTNNVELTVWRPSNGMWYALDPKTGTYRTKQWGLAGDVPVPGSYATGGNPFLFPLPAFATYRPSKATWYVTDVYGGRRPDFIWGEKTDKTVPADYNGDGVTDYAIWRPSTGVWWIVNSNFWTAPKGGKGQTQQWGQVGDIPMPYDYDNDRRADMTVWRPSNGTWYIINSKSWTWLGYQWGQVGDVPVYYYVSPPPAIIK